MSEDKYFDEPEFRQVNSIDEVGKHAGGRPTLYKPEYADRVRKIYLLNSSATDKDVAIQFDVDERTVNRWKLEYPEFCQSIKDGREIADEQVANSLFSLTQKRRKKVEKVFVSKGEPVKIESFEELEPDAKACQLWLNNRRPKEWRNATTEGDTSVHILVDTQTQDTAKAWLSEPKDGDDE